MATITIDGQSYEADPSANLLQAALTLGFDLPYFCWHPALGSVGACRQCAVRQYRDEEDTTGQIVMACMVPVADGLRCSIVEPEAAEFRAEVIEWLMSNHPHDCPVCDEGGECHLQDMTVMTGHCKRRFRFPKRTFRNQYLGPFINHEMNRCIQCYRCVRFYGDYAGGSDLVAMAAHNHVYFGRHEEGILENEFSGNLVEICPTGVFTDKTLKHHYSRKWDMVSSPSVCSHCAVGCNTIASTRYGSVRRILNRYHHDINGYFLCDRGRFGYTFTDAADRLRRPLLHPDRERDVETVAEPAEAMKRIREIFSEATGVAGIGSPRASLESNYALRNLVGSGRFSSGLPRIEHDATTALLEAMRNAPDGPGSLRDAERADAVLILGEDPNNTAPRLALALRQSVRNEPIRADAGSRIPRWHDRAIRDFVQDRKGPLFIAWPASTRLDDLAAGTHRAAPDEIARLGFAVAHAIDPQSPAVTDLDDSASDLASRIARALKEADRPMVVSGTALRSPAIIAAAAATVHALRRTGSGGSSFLAVAPEANTIGDAMLEGAPLETLEQQLESGEVDTLVILENDIYRRLPAPATDRIISKARRIIALDSIATATTNRADVVLPAGSFAESDGTFVNHEGRAQRFFQPLPPAGDVLEAWRWIGRIAAETGTSKQNEWDRLDRVLTALARDCPELAPARDAAPDAAFRANGQRFPRAPRRFSGRTSILSHLSVHEPKPPEDSDSPLSFTMEGHSGQPPAALVSHYWSPGWNSSQALNKFQSEVAGPARGGDPGARLIPGNGPNERPSTAIPAPVPDDDQTLLAVPCYEVFGSDELSARAPAVAERIPKPYVALAPTDAEHHGLDSGDSLNLLIGELRVSAPVRLDPKLPPGLCGIPAGMPGWSVPHLPARASVVT